VGVGYGGGGGRGGGGGSDGRGGWGVWWGGVGGGWGGGGVCGGGRGGFGLGGGGGGQQKQKQQKKKKTNPKNNNVPPFFVVGKVLSPFIWPLALPPDPILLLTNPSTSFSPLGVLPAVRNDVPVSPSPRLLLFGTPGYFSLFSSFWMILPIPKDVCRGPVIGRALVIFPSLRGTSSSTFSRVNCFRANPSTSQTAAEVLSSYFRRIELLAFPPHRNQTLLGIRSTFPCRLVFRPPFFFFSRLQLRGL